MIINNRKKAKKEFKELRIFLLKLYDKNNQKLYITSWEWKKNKNNFLDVIAIDKENIKTHRYLFTIMNLNAFNELKIRYDFYTQDTGFYEHYDVVGASVTPFYFDQAFTLKKFTPITKDDVVNCCRYFVEKVLKEFWIWNIIFIQPRSKTLSEILLEERRKQ